MSDDGITRKDLIDMEGRLLKHLDVKLEHVETALLTEFHKWASPVDSKLRTHRSWFYEVDLEVEALKERVRKLEAGEKPSH
jgi:hypothetical protein